MHPALAAINAAERCIAALRRGAAVSTRDLTILCNAAGDPCELLRRRVRVGWCPTDTATALRQLQDYIDDRRLELPR